MLRSVDVDLEAATPKLRVIRTLARIDKHLVRNELKTPSARRVVPLAPAAVDALRDARLQQKRDRLAAGPAWTDTGYEFTTEIGTPVDPRNALRWFYTVRQRVRIEQMIADTERTHTAEVAAAGTACPVCHRAANDYLDGSLHTLQHSAASVLLGAGVPMPIVKDVWGLSSIAVTVDLYGHMAPVIESDAMNQGMSGSGVGT